MKNLLITSLLLLTACATEKHRVLAVTGTVIGVEIAQNPQTQMYTAKLGYNRVEFASVPTNRGSKEGEASVGNGAKDAADVIMELRYGNLFSFTEASIYQRLAVGSIAVSQPGAALMFAKDNSGTLDTATAEAVTRNIKSIPPVNPDISSQLLSLAQAYSKSDKGKFDAIAIKNGYISFSDFLTSKDNSVEKVKAISDALRQAGLIL